VLFPCCVVLSQRQLANKQESEEWEERAGRNKGLMDWYNKHLVKSGTNVTVGGFITLPVNYISHPERSIRCRGLNKDAVDYMAESFDKNGVIDANIKTIVWETEATKNGHFECDVKLNEPPSKIFAIIGGHSSAGLQKNHLLFPRKVRFHTVKFQMAIVPKTDENIQFALGFGTLDNTVKSMHNKMTMWECAEQHHDNWVMIQRKYKGDAAKIDMKWKAYQKIAEDTMNFKGGTFHTFASFAKHEGEVWDLLECIFNGKYKINKKLRGQKQPTALTHFSSMANIPSTKLIAWLTRVCEGQWTCKQFAQRVALYKLNERVKDDLLEYVKQLRPDYRLQTLSKLIEIYPMAGQAMWFEALVKCVSQKKKEKLSAHAKSMIDDMLKAQELANTEDANKPKVNFVLLCVF
jgi:hypothetical protein